MTTSLVKTITRSTTASSPAVHTISAQEFIALYDELFPRIYTYVHYRCEDFTIADDLTSAIFEKALNHLSTYRSSIAPFCAWLFGIARNEINKYLRSLSTQNHLTIEDVHDHPAHDPTPEEALIESENYHELLSAMYVLNDRERDLLGLKFASLFTNRQISEITGLSETNVGVIVYRAIHKLRKELQPGL
jgi:RNA polymerase sigma-70 factor (ECF subfamily)